MGTSGGIPIPERAQAGVLVESENLNILLDCGMGVPLRLAEAGVKAESIDIVCLTHGHLDHIQDLPSLTKASWLDVGEADYTIITPPGLEKKLLDFFKSLDEYDRTDLSFEELKPGDSFREAMKVQAVKTDHTPFSQGYHISEGNKKLIYTGDTAPCKDIMDKAEGAELLIHELSLLEKSEVHTDPQSLISMVEETEVNELVLTHFYPQVAERIDHLTEEIERESGINTTEGVDLLEYDI